MLTLCKIFDKVKKIGIYISGFFIIVMMSYIVADVVTRNLFNFSLIGSIEFVQYYLMPLAIFPAIAFTYGSGIMPRIDMIVIKYNQKFQRLLAIVLLIFELILFALLTYYGGKYALMNFNEYLGFSTGGITFSYYPVILSVPISMGLVCIEIILLIVKNMTGEKVSLKLIEE